MGKPQQDIEDIDFILTEIDKHSNMTIEGFRVLIKEDSFYPFYTLDLPSGNHIQIGPKAALRFRSLAKRHCNLYKHIIDVSSLERAIKIAFAKTFIEDEKPIEIKYIDRMLNKAVKEAQKTHKVVTHYLPCVITIQGKPDEFKIGPVRFLTTEKFFKDFGCKIENDIVSYGFKKDGTIVTNLNDYYKSFVWVAEVNVPMCDYKISEERAIQVVQAALDVLKLFFHQSNGHDLKIGYYTDCYRDRAKITRTPDGMFHPEVGRRIYGIPANPMWYTDIIKSKGKGYLVNAGPVIERYLKPEKKNELYDRWLNALYWYGQAVSEDRPAEQLVKYVAALECLTVTPLDGKDNVTDIVTRRTAILLAGACNGNFDAIYANARKLYSKRSDLMHGRISPIKKDISSIVSLAHKIVPDVLLVTLELFLCLDMNGRNSSKELFNEYKLLEEGRENMTTKIIDDPQELFRRWYKDPLDILGNYNIVPRGDGGWIALATSCFLFERYVSVKNKLDKKKLSINKNDIIRQLVIDFNTDKDTAKIFWDCVRNGLLHKGMPKQKGGPTWEIYDDMPAFKLNDEKKVIYINVWKFKDRVIEILDNNPDYLKHGDYPWGHIWHKY